MANPILPKAQSHISETNRETTREWYEFFRRLLIFIQESGADPGVIQSILERLDELEQAGDSFQIQGLMSANVTGTPASGLVQISLDGDVETPGNIYYYGTNSAGVKGWSVLSAMVPSPNTTQNFWRGDLAWSNELEGPFSARATADAATLGPDLTTNGTFTGSAAGWTLGAGWAYVANNVVLTNPGAGTLSQNITVTAGVTYLISWSQQHSSANNVILTPSIGAAVGVPSTYTAITANTQSQIITPVASGSIALTFTPTAGTTGTLTVDTVSVVAVNPIPFTLELENAAGNGVIEHRAFTSATSVAIGLGSGQSNVTGTSNTFIGRFAGMNNTTATSNTFFGQQAGQKTTTGGANNFQGQSTGFNNTTGSNNTFVGSQAGLNNTTGNNNTTFGFQSGSNNIAGSGNVFAGLQCAQFHADGVTPLTDPENSVYVGRLVRGFDNSDSNSIVIGNQAIGRGANTAQWGNTSIINHYFSGSIQYVGKVFVTAKSGFPTPVAGVITLANNTNYEVSGFIDLTGDRIVCGTNNAIFGQTADADGLISTGLPGGSALITSTSSLEIRNLRLSAPTGRIFDLNDGATNSLNWTGVQIIDTPTIGTIQNYANIVMNQQIVQNSANLTLDGTIASFVSETALWDGRTGQTTIIVPSTAIFTRRFRMLYTAVSVQPGETGINFSTTATIPDESYILDNVSFTGGGTYLAGLDYTSNKSSFFRCFGITNTNAICQYSMTGNVTATVIAATGTFVKVAGTTVASALNQKFSTATTNRGEYTGAFPADFNVSVTASMRSGNNQNIRMRIAKNGTTIAESNSSFITTGAGDASAVPAQTLTSLAPTDYLEVWVCNDTAVNNIIVSDLNVIARRLG